MQYLITKIEMIIVVSKKQYTLIKEMYWISFEKCQL